MHNPPYISQDFDHWEVHFDVRGYEEDEIHHDYHGRNIQLSAVKFMHEDHRASHKDLKQKIAASCYVPNDVDMETMAWRYEEGGNVVFYARKLHHYWTPKDNDPNHKLHYPGEGQRKHQVRDYHRGSVDRRRQTMPPSLAGRDSQVTTNSAPPPIVRTSYGTHHNPNQYPGGRIPEETESREASSVYDSLISEKEAGPSQRPGQQQHVRRETTPSEVYQPQQRPQVNTGSEPFQTPPPPKNKTRTWKTTRSSYFGPSPTDKHR